MRKFLALPALLLLVPLASVSQEAIWQASPIQAAPGNQRLGVHAHEYPTQVAAVVGADVHIVITRQMDRTPILTSSIQQLRILDTDGRPIEFTDPNPDELQFESVMSGRSTYAATYELVDPSRIRRLAEVRFEYLGRDFVFDMRAREPMPDDDSELVEVQVGGTRIRPANPFQPVRCIPETYIETRLTPSEQVREDSDPEVRQGREAVERYLTADMTRNHSALSLNYGHSEVRGDDVWFFYATDYGCTSMILMTHDRVTMSWNRKTGEIQGRNP